MDCVYYNLLMCDHIRQRRINFVSYIHVWYIYEIQTQTIHTSLCDVCTGNIDCEGEGIVEQAEFCHYSRRNKCGPPAILLLEGLNITAARGDGLGGEEGELCSCEFSGGQRVCLLGEEDLAT